MPIEFAKNAPDFDKYVASNKILVANFTALWCGPCQAVKPVLDELYEDPSGKYANVEFVRVDLDSQQQLASRYQVTSVPTFVFLESGQETGRVVGANMPEIIKQLDRMVGKEGSRHGNGEKAALEATPSFLEVSQCVPKGYEVLNLSIYYGGFEALNALPLAKGGDVKDVFRLEKKAEESTVLSDADSQLLFYVPFVNILKVYSVLVKFRNPHDIAGEDLELDDDELREESQVPAVLKLWPNHNSILSFDDATSDAAPHVEKLEGVAHGWYEAKVKFVRFQNVQSLNIFVEGAEEDLHTVVDKIVVVGVSGESKEQQKLNKGED